MNKMPFFPGFLNAACARPFKGDYVLLKAETANYTLIGITITDEVTVRSTYLGQPHEENYPAGTTSISFNADADTDIMVIGGLSEIYSSNGNAPKTITVSSGVLTRLLFYSMGGNNTTTTSVVILHAETLNEVKFDMFKNLEMSLAELPSVTKFTLVSSNRAKSVNLSNSPLLNSCTISSCLALETINLAKSAAMHYVSATPFEIMNCIAIKEIYFRATDSSYSTQIATLITNADAADGVVYLNSDDAYYQTVADAATAKGWTIEALPV